MSFSMEKEYMCLRQKIKDELAFLCELSNEIDFFLEECQNSQISSMHRRNAGSILHDFYTAAEKIFSDIAKRLDGGVPTSDRWHIELLESMATEPQAQTRPPVISNELKDELEEYLKFRHLFRNIYGPRLCWNRLEELLTELKNTVLMAFVEEIEKFDLLLKNCEENC